MHRRLRTFIGAVVMVLFVGLYALVVMALAQPLLAGASRAVQAVFYLVTGVGWILPLMPLIRWMEGRRDPATPPP